MTLADYELRTPSFAAYRNPPGYGPRTNNPGRVLWAVTDWVSVLADGMEYQCKMRGAAKRADKSGERVYPVVGDLVEFTETNVGQGVVERVLPRENVFARRMAGPRGTWKAQVLAANIDQVVTVFAAAQPEPNPRLVDRFLVIAEANELDALLVVNKVDLTGIEAARAVFGQYERAGYPVWYASAHEGTGLEGLREALSGRTSLVAGPSGVGKSSLLNTLLPGLDLRTGEVSQALNKGRHTTVVGSLIRVPGPEGGFVADTPGLRELGLWDMPPEDVDYCYREFRPFLGGCRFSNCLHRGENGCAVLEAVQRGDIEPQRYDSYLRVVEDTETAQAARLT